MTSLVAVLAEVRSAHTAAALAVVVGAALLLRLTAPGESARLRWAGALLLAHLALLPVIAGVDGYQPEAARHLRLAAGVLELTAVVVAAVSVAFGVVLPRLHLHAPAILREVLVAAILVVAFFGLASSAGYNLSGLIATSTVLTAIIGLSFQDTLGNVVSGLALQMDRSIAVGDWVRIGDVTGRVTEIRWRFTAVETRNWETVVLPNSVLVKNPVVVLGRRQQAPAQWRRWVHFNVDYRHSPADVIAAVEGALRASPIAGVAAEPPAHCILVDLAESFSRYAVRYWLTDLANDDATDSLVRMRLFVALKRAAIPLSMPAQAVFLTEESAERKAQKTGEEMARRTAALQRVDLFHALDDDDRRHLAEHLHFAPFSAGEAITRQGEVADWLYMLLEGEASVRITDGGQTQEVSRLVPGDFFGEMGLMTGARRSATVVALADAACYRLEKAGFEEIIHQRPDLAEKVAEVLASRRWRLDELRGGMGADARSQQAAVKHDLVGRIRSFFGIA